MCSPEVKLWCTMVFIFMCTPLLQGQQEELIDTASNVISEEEEASVLKTRAQELGEVLRRRLTWLRRPRGKDSRLDLVFLVDASSSVGPDNFASELRFVRKLLADLEVSTGATRVALVTFASSAERHVDTVSDSSDTPRHKCDILERALPAVNYSGGATFTLGAMLEAQAILKNARPGSRRAVFLLTDGYSNGGDPLPAARALREELGATVFTFGVRSGNTRELADMASKPAHEHAFLLPSFEQFAALARRALHQDLRSGARLEVQDDAACAAVLCSHGSDDCGCAEGASCVCDTLTGRSQCVCPAGFQGSGLRADCQQCPAGTFAMTQRVLKSVNTSLAELQYSSKCSPCPDPAHESPPGSTAVNQCRCREGFVVSDTNPLNCQVLECPVLQPPSRGSFVGGPCARVFNAACGVTCATGHRLVGSSIRLCRADGTWSGQAPRCARRECPPLETPRNGWVRCSGRSKDEKKSRAVDATCEVGCESPYALLGSRTRTCLALGAWDGLPSTCKAVTCAAVPIPRRAIVSPESCVARTKQPAGHECRFTCREHGFGLRGAEIRRCGENGRWSGNKPRCVDIQPPELICPKDVTIQTLPDEDVAELNVSWPNITDNSGGAVRLRISPPVILTGGRLGIGRQRITLRATDPAGNFATCRFVVTVRDKQAPDVQGCESPPVFLTAADEAPNVTWSEPSFSDNSGQDPKINCTHQQGARFKRGVTEVRYEARDEAGNVASCVINITVEGLQCETPLHGYCLEDERGACSLVCDEGYAFALAPDPDVTCNPTLHDSPFPDCSVMTLPNSFSQHLSAELPQDETQDDCNLLANSIEAEISSAVSQACTGIECHLQRVSDPCAQEELVPQPQSEDEENNVVTRRKRRRASRNRVYTEYKIRAQNSSHSITFRLVGQLRVPGTGPSGVRATLGTVKALLTTTNAGGTARNTSQKLPALRIRLDPPELGCPAGSVLRATDICVQCPRGTFLKPGAKECFLCGVGFFQPKPGEQACLPCPKGTSTKPGTLSTKRQHCRPLCKPGTRSRDGVTPCSPCPLGTFQPLSGQRACTPCPANMTTQRRGATDKQFCKVPCAAGSVSRSGLAPCLLCPAGYSQPRTGQKVCEPGASICALSGICPPPLHASHPCLRSPCHASSTCLPLHPRQSRHFRCHCPPGRTGTFCEEEVRDVCASSPCDNGGTCIPGINDALSSCDCLPACESDSCEDGNVTTSCVGETCERNNNHFPLDKGTTACCPKANFTCNCTAGFSGSMCEEDIDECEEMPCGEFGLCTDLPGGFLCDCAPGYGGTQCEMIESACSALEPCVTGVCLDEPGASFHCECPATRGGVRCEEIRDPCEAKGCLNGATCVPEPWPEQEEIGQLPNASCVCLSGYHGERCEKLDALNPHNACSSSPCLNGGTCRPGVSNELLGGFTCTCTGGFAGETCNITLPKDAVLRFPGGGSLGYVLRENALSRPLQELTLCSWLRTADTLNYGTPVSYATPQQDNTLALTDYSGFVVYVNGERAVTDVAVNDGAWHLVCLLWASRPRGAWRLYKDGILSDQGEGLANNTQIPGGGTLVLGQEQDSPGGSFSSAQSFLGRLGPTALWPTLLSPTRLRAMFERCGDDETIADLAGVNTNEEEAITAGDAVALWSWKDALSGIRGKLQLESSEFCAGCTPPLTPPHGLVNVSGVGAAAVATFSCQPGFRPVGARRAECGKRGTWQTDSPQPPTCQRLSCGKPIAPANSKLLGSGFEFESKLRVVCLTGFVLPSNAIEFIECLSSGKWSPLPPPCVEARCSLKNLSKITNGTWQHLRGSGEELVESAKATDARVGEQVELVCETGLAARGASLLTCLDGGHWDINDESLCVHPACVKSPPRLQHARIPLVSGVKARYSCFPNHTMQGSPLVTCVDGWRPLPTCVSVATIVRCPSPPRVENANVSLDSGRARYVCADGFNLEGEAEVRCSKTGTWPPAPVCQAVAKCLTSPELEHGTVTVLNDVANLVCNKGYFLEGVAEFRCEGSSWIGEAKCHVLGCHPPKPVEHGTVSVTRGRGAGPQVLKGAIAEYKCAHGYQLVGPRARKCLSHEQQWSSVEPYCKPVAP